MAAPRLEVDHDGRNHPYSRGPLEVPWRKEHEPRAPAAVPRVCAEDRKFKSSSYSATSAQTPEAYWKSLSDLGERSQPAQRRVQRQQRANHSSADSRAAHTTLRSHSESLTAFIRSAATFVAATAQEQDMRSRSSVSQVASSADSTATAPRSRGGSNVTCRSRKALRIEDSDYRSRGGVRRRTRRGSSKSNSQREEDTGTGSSGSAACARTFAAHLEDTRRTTAQAPRGPSRLAQWFRPVPGVDSSVFNVRRCVRDKSDFALPGAPAQWYISSDEDDPGYGRRRVQLPRSVCNDRAPAQDMQFDSDRSGEARTKTSISATAMIAAPRGHRQLVQDVGSVPDDDSVLALQ
ncbi:hypothetical protein EDB84DRAFT_1572231 [Lactarius hengduanensis]|nr:hypothetical protein EDB84DRAFT_1572231 [Lactarius hengduanensis]